MNEILRDFYKKESVTILITDSGLGGLSVAAQLEQNFQKYHPFKKVNLIFVNALASETYFYNQMENTEEKVRVFNNALAGMTKHYNPDLILIACNTLSVIYEQTNFSKTTPVPVVGIVEFGVVMLEKELAKSENNRALILGTPTTMGQNTHKNKLLENGYKNESVSTQACMSLESEIQTDPKSDMVRTMIEMYAQEGLGNLSIPENGQLAVGLCCTHYQYAGDMFAKVISELSGKPVTVLDPNVGMSNFIFEQSDVQKFKTTAIRTEVISQAKVNPVDINSISNIIEPISPAFSKALQNYTYKQDLFSY